VADRVGTFGRSRGREVFGEGLPLSRGGSGSWGRVGWLDVWPASALATGIFIGDIALFHGDGARPRSCSLLMAQHQQKIICPNKRRGAGV